MRSFEAVQIVEGFAEERAGEDVVVKAWQHLVDTGLAWNLQGWFGRTATDLIKAGVINEPQRGVTCSV